MQKTFMAMAAAALLLVGWNVVEAQEDRRGAREERRAGFSFAVIGDMPYGAAAVLPVDRLINEVNRDREVAFVVHVGDIKAGSELCDNALIRARFDQLQKFRTPLFYTPGDNEWTDCHRVNNGGYVPTERLSFLRNVFFPNPDYTTGGRAIRVNSQARMPGFATFVENAWFKKGGVLFATVHVVGSNNNLAPWSGIDAADTVERPRADRLAEFTARQAANLAWLDEVFKQGKDSKAIYLAMQANPNFELPVGNANRAGFDAFLAKLKTLSEAYAKPVLLSQGDNHVLIIDQPFGSPLFTRMQGFGELRVHWMKVSVDPQSTAVFSFEPQLVAGN